MAEERVQRRLAAILSADVVGYSRLMGHDETGTLAALKAHRRELIGPKSAEYHGRIVKLTGDGTLMEFGSAVDAVLFAVDVQRAILGRNAEVPEDRRIIYRMGINIGDIIVEGDDIYGDGVNVAARLEGLADPGGVCVSRTVYDHIKGKVELGFKDLGEQKVKNITEPVHVYRIEPDDIGTQNVAPSTAGDALPLPDKPSIAVLPFDNMSSDVEQGYISDGVTEDIITALSKFRWLFVIARNSTIAYKGQSVDIRKVATELGVRYILEGSVRRRGDRIRVSGQLIDANTGVHIWAEHFDRDFEDIFAVQDQVTESIVAAIAPEIELAEIERAKRKPPNDLDAWALYQRGLALYPSGAEKDFQLAIELFDRARQADPEFVDAIAMAAQMRTRYAYLYDSGRDDELLEEATQLLQVAMRLDPRNPICHMALGRLHYTLGEYDLAVVMARKAVTLNPNYALAHYGLGITLFGANRYEESLQHKDIALRLSPNDPSIANMLVGRASALFMLGRFEECAESALRSSKSPNPQYPSDSLAVAALTILGRTAEAEAAKKSLLDRKPDFSVLEIEKFYFSAHPPDKAKKYCDALRKAGLPE
jgi:adenylate cyclase